MANVVAKRRLCSVFARKSASGSSSITIPSGVTLTGGCSALEGLGELAEEIFESPVRPGTPTHVGGLQDVVRGPMYATGVGLALFGAAQGTNRAQTRFRIRDDSIFGRVKQRMRDWFYEDLH